MSKFRSVAIVAVVMLSLTACTTNETAPSKVSWGDLAEGKRLDAHLESKRRELRALSQEAAGLSERLNRRRGDLASAARALSSETAKSAEAKREERRINADIQRAQQKLEALESRIKQIRRDTEELRSQKSKLEDRRAATRLIARREIEVKNLEKEVVNLERTIERILLVRAKHGLKYN